MSYLQNHLAKMRLHAEELNHKVPLKSEVKSNSPRQFTPLTAQIEALMQSTPPKLLNRPWSMAELVARLDGKYRDRPHPQHVGHALRIIGWNYRRYWRPGYNGARVWLPPDI
jgi:hypothetical protein